MRVRDELSDVLNKREPDGFRTANIAYRVLVVDDSTVMRKIITQHLKSQAYDICGEAANGKEAIEMYKELDPDVVTLDINMPIVDGTTALKHILAYDPDARIVMVTSEGQKETVVEAIQAGAKGFIVKPPDKNSVCGRVREALGK
jgi:two-component system, chemotaxis family, chemotaxis protein CheY